MLGIECLCVHVSTHNRPCCAFPSLFTRFGSFDIDVLNKCFVRGLHCLESVVHCRMLSQALGENEETESLCLKGFIEFRGTENRTTDFLRRRG